MKSQRSRQSGQRPKPTPEIDYGAAWLEVPEEVVWELVSDLAARYTYRGVGKVAGLSAETVRKFVERIGKPQRATKKRFAELFLEHHPRGYLDMKTRKQHSGPIIRPLKSVFPPGEDNALDTVDVILEAAKRHTQVDAAVLDDFRGWLEIQFAAEYRGIRRNYYELERKRQRQQRAAAKGAERAKENG